MYEIQALDNLVIYIAYLNKLLQNRQFFFVIHSIMCSYIAYLPSPCIYICFIFHHSLNWLFQNFQISSKYNSRTCHSPCDQRISMSQAFISLTISILSVEPDPLPSRTPTNHPLLWTVHQESARSSHVEISNHFASQRQGQCFS